MPEIEVPIRRTLEVGWSPQDAFELVADVPRSASHFPGLKKLEDLGDGVFRWHLSSFKVGRFDFPVQYAARYVSDASAQTVTWSTMGSMDNTRSDGEWLVVPHGNGSRLEFTNRLIVSLPVPRLMMRAARRMAREMTERQLGSYLDRMARKMDGTVV
ncbi:MAG: SRPBCC family protein [Myxococcota bacterium]|nr:SRPBCC family protein [Myxococcota bacterium]